MNENKYNPSEEEMKNTEDMMGPKKAELSAAREKNSQLLKEKMGVDGYLESNFDASANFYVMSGKINGHDIIITRDIDDVTKRLKDSWKGKVDGYNLSPEETERLMGKYRHITTSLYQEELDVAQKEEVAPGRAEVLKDIGL